MLARTARHLYHLTRVVCILPLLGALSGTAAAAAIPTLSRDPCLGAIAVDAADGRVVYEENAATVCYPASVLKLMDLLILQERIEAGTLKLTDPVTVTAEAAKTGGSQVYLKEKEVFPVEELLYALVVQSANDAAVALAIHVAGTKDAFAELMNQKARELGMAGTVFRSVHGLPPGPGQEPDLTTAQDLAKLAVALLKHPDVLRYTSTQERPFRNGTFILRTHNPLLATFQGCDGLKTGYYTQAGFSMVTTAQRNGRRVVAVVVGSKSKEARNAKAAELLSKALTAVPATPPPPPAPKLSKFEQLEQMEGADKTAPPPASSGLRRKLAWGAAILAVIAVSVYLVRRRSALDEDHPGRNVRLR